MDFKEIKGTKHYLYDNEQEIKIQFPEIAVKNNWRNGQEGEWIFTDDDNVCQILRKFAIKETNGKGTHCIRTVVGTFQVRNKTRKMLGEDGVAENIYRFSGKNAKQGDLSKKQTLFARYIATGVNPKDAYKTAYPTAKKDKYINEKVNSLLKTESIISMIDKKIQEILDEEGVSPNYIIQRYKTIADVAESDSNRLRALDSLSKMSGLFATESKKSEQLTVWAGFTPEQLESIKDGKKELLAHKEKEAE